MVKCWSACIIYNCIYDVLLKLPMLNSSDSYLNEFQRQLINLAVQNRDSFGEKLSLPANLQCQISPVGPRNINASTACLLYY